MVGRRNKVLAAAALWGACAWFLSLDVDFLITNLRSAPHWLLQVFRALFMGVSVAVGLSACLIYGTRGAVFPQVLLRRPLACTTHKLPEFRFVRWVERNPVSVLNSIVTLFRREDYSNKIRTARD